MNKKGFTLIELLLYISITGVMILALTSFFASATQTRIRSQSVSEVNQQAMFAMNRITKTIKNSTDINSPSSGNFSPTLSVDTLLPSNNPTIFALNSGDLTIKEGPNPAINLTGGLVNIDSISFTNLSKSGTPGAIRIELNLSRDNPSGRAEYEYQTKYTTTVSLRQ